MRKEGLEEGPSGRSCPFPGKLFWLVSCDPMSTRSNQAFCRSRTGRNGQICAVTNALGIFATFSGQIKCDKALDVYKNERRWRQSRFNIVQLGCWLDRVEMGQPGL